MDGFVRGLISLKPSINYCGSEEEICGEIAHVNTGKFTSTFLCHS